MPSEVIEYNKIHYSLTFDDPLKKNLFFVHGASCDSRVYSNVMRILSRDFNVMAVDLNGHGDSEGEGFRNVVDHAFICAELIRRKQLGNWNIIGHSLGGAIGLAMAVYTSNLIESLILVGTGSRLRVPDSFLQAIRDKKNNAQINKEFLESSIVDSSNVGALDSLLHIMDSANPKAVYKDWLAADSFDFTRRLKAIDLRCLIICGDHDSLTPVKYHEYLLNEIPGSRLNIIKDCGHWPFVEKEKIFTDKIKHFLKNQ